MQSNSEQKPGGRISSAEPIYAAGFFISAAALMDGAVFDAISAGSSESNRITVSAAFAAGTLVNALGVEKLQLKLILLLWCMAAAGLISCSALVAAPSLPVARITVLVSLFFAGIALTQLLSRFIWLLSRVWGIVLLGAAAGILVVSFLHGATPEFQLAAAAAAGIPAAVWPYLRGRSTTAETEFGKRRLATAAGPSAFLSASTVLAWMIYFLTLGGALFLIGAALPLHYSTLLGDALSLSTAAALLLACGGLGSISLERLIRLPCNGLAAITPLLGIVLAVHAFTPEDMFLIPTLILLCATGFLAGMVPTLALRLAADLHPAHKPLLAWSCVLLCITICVLSNLILEYRPDASRAAAGVIICLGIGLAALMLSTSPARAFRFRSCCRI